jgi:hypothetical protein
VDSFLTTGSSDKATSKNESITISSGSSLSDSGIESMFVGVRGGGASEARRVVYVGSNRADSIAENALKGFEDKLDKDEAENIKEKNTALRDSSITAQQLKEQTDALQVDSVQQDAPHAF